MIDYNTPPELTMDHIAILLKHMQPADVKKYNEYCMIHFPGWLFKIIKREADHLGMSYESFVRIACINEVVRQVEKRKLNEANGNI
ncbi:hypothetical protein [Methylobacter sp.]|uniref:hypothetical protein n=1 Tax=Methylobacter sp. TaxID=2051955 RepID=UPI003DA21403